MNRDDTNRALSIAQADASALLFHSVQCNSCFNAFAEGGKLGSACAAGRTLRVQWARSAERLQVARVDDIPGVCQDCQS